MDIEAAGLIGWALLAIAMLAAGAAGGFVAGLLGVGGGIVIVPVLDLLLGRLGIPDEWRMHVAVATALATVIPTSISSTRAHHARGSVDWGLARRWAVPMLLGSFGGSLVAAQLPSRVLAAVFGFACVLIALKMLLPLDHVRLAKSPPRGASGWAIASVIGSVSSMMGIGGGSLSVPTMTLAGESIHRAVGTAAFFGFVISVPGTLGYLLARPEAALPTATVGLVSIVGLMFLAPATILTAPLGARTAHTMSRRTLTLTFGGFMSVVAARMLYRAFV